jgi:hypothetical protein
VNALPKIHWHAKDPFSGKSGGKMKIGSFSFLSLIENEKLKKNFLQIIISPQFSTDIAHCHADEIGFFFFWIWDHLI